jgi:DHA1 family bicyclomycin/chloramphenicol resistance-like MFS transporter
MPTSAKNVMILGALAAFGGLCIDAYLPALPTISVELGASVSTAQLSLTACLIGLALGQLVFGPISDRLGRRRPLFFGITAFVVASAGCAVAPSIGVLIAFRFVQGLGGSAGIVIGRAIVRDQYSGVAAARFFSLLLLISGAAPILGPQIGAALLLTGSWRSIFLALAIAGSAVGASAARELPETLPSDRQEGRSLASIVRTLHMVATDRRFVVDAFAGCLAYGATFAYIGGSSFALENVYGVSPQLFGAIFAVNAASFIAASQVNRRLLMSLQPARLLNAGLVALSSAGGLLLLAVNSETIGLPGVLLCLFATLAAIAFITPNAMALALEHFPLSIGSAAALVGVLQFGIGAITAPLVGLGGSHNATPMAIVIAMCGILGLALRAMARVPE